VRLRQNLIAALTLTAIAIPEQLATAQLAGMPAGQGVAVFAAAALAMALACRDRTLSVGADSTIAPVIAAAVASAAAPGAAALMAAMVGLILLAIALFRLEGVARLLSAPVAAGMMAGIAAHIVVGRLPEALALDVAPGSVVDTLRAVWIQQDAARFEPLLLMALVTGLCLLGARAGKALPGPLAAIVCAAGVAAWVDPSATLFPRSVGDSLSWGLTPPDPSRWTILALLPAAIAAALLCVFQTTAVLRDGDGDTPALRRNAFAATGLANLAAAAIGGFAVNASPPRTRILRDAGASSQWVGVIAAVIGVGALIAAPDILRRLPTAALAGVLTFVAIRIFPTAQLRALLAQSRAEAGIALGAMALVTLLPLEFGLPLAMLTSLLYATLPLFTAQVVELRPIPGTTIWWRRPDEACGCEDTRVLVLGLTSPLSFANAEGVMSEIRAFVAGRRQRPDVLVLEGAGVLSVDFTAAERLKTLLGELGKIGLAVGLARVESERASEQLRRTGVLDALGPDRLFESVDQAIKALSPGKAASER
jgi:SulP family sulfate permease